MPLVHWGLRLLALRPLGQERAGHTLEATSLINAGYIPLIDTWQAQLQNGAATSLCPTS